MQEPHCSQSNPCKVATNKYSANKSILNMRIWTRNEQKWAKNHIKMCKSFSGVSSNRSICGQTDLVLMKRNFWVITTNHHYLAIDSYKLWFFNLQKKLGRFSFLDQSIKKFVNILCWGLNLFPFFVVDRSFRFHSFFFSCQSDFNLVTVCECEWVCALVFPQKMYPLYLL